MFQASVVIPVYNAEKFLSNAVLSAVNLSEVAEILLIEDASPDNALQLCKILSEKYEKVKLFRHPNGENRGAGESRNLGIEKANSEYVAFLDADDYYLPNRFEAEAEIIKQGNGVDGIYGATGFYYQNSDKGSEKLTTIDIPVAPEDLLKHLIFNKGHFHLNALTVKKDALVRVGLFNTGLRLHQDTHLCLKLAFHSTLVGGILDKPVAIRRVHSQNRIKSRNLDSKSEYFEELYKYFKFQKGLPVFILKKIKSDYIKYKYFKFYFKWKRMVHHLVKNKISNT